MKTIDAQYYNVGAENIWTGRETNEERAYWYQVTQLINAQEGTFRDDLKYGIIGYQCEEGVRRNQGRVGAKDGPDAIRRQLSKTACHHNHDIGDLGNIVCHDEQMEHAQAQLANLVSNAIDQSVFPIVLGGGHDVALGTFNGIVSSEKGKGKRIGIINFDAHFDLRPVVDHGNSGTPFNQILSQDANGVDYLVLGLQKAANTKSLFDIADQHNVDYRIAPNCTMHQLHDIHDLITDFSEKVDVIYITIDMDGFSSAFAPGVSAPSPMGMEPLFVQTCLRLLKFTRKVIAIDIAEMNPKFDRDSCTAKLAARLIDTWVS